MISSSWCQHSWFLIQGVSLSVLLRMGKSTMANRTTSVGTVAGSLCKTHKTKWLTRWPKTWLTNCYWNAFPWQELPEWLRSPSFGCNAMSMRNMPLCPAAWTWRLKKGALNNSMRWVVVICSQQTQQTMGLVSNRHQDTWNCGSVHWRAFGSRSQRTLAILACGLPTVCSVLHRFLDSLWRSPTKQTASSSRERKWQNQLS